MVTQEFRNAAYPQETGEAFVFLVEITHDSLAAPIYLTDMRYDGPLITRDANDAYILSTGGKDYICAAIEIIPPGQSDEEPQGKIRVPNVDQRIGEAIDSIVNPATVSVTAVLESDPTIVVGGPHRFLKLQNVQGDAMMFEGDLLRPQLSSAPWPKQWLRPAKFLAAYRR